MEKLSLHEFLFRLESTNVVVIEGLVVLEEDRLGDVVVQSHHEVKLHRNGVVHADSSQGNLHLLEVHVDGLGSLDGVLQLALKLFRVGWRNELSRQSSLCLGPTHVVGLRRCVKPPCVRVAMEVSCGALNLIFERNLVKLEVVVHQNVPT